MLDGVDLSPLWLGREAPEREALFWHFPAYLEGKSDRFESFRTVPGGAMRKGNWKLIEFFEPRPDGTPHVELYDLANDPRETADRAAAEPERTRAMLAELRRWRAEVGAEVPTEPEPEYRRAEGGR